VTRLICEVVLAGASDEPASLLDDMEAMARASSIEAFNDVLATIVRADEVVAMDAGRTVVA
jgi:hypothetical protein